MNEEPRHPELRQEEDRLDATPILLVFALVGLVGVLLVLWAWYGLERRERALRPSGVFAERALGPRRAIGEDLETIFGDTGPGQALNEQKRAQIASFAWVDRRRRVISIPIEDAIDWMLAEGGP